MIANDSSHKGGRAAARPSLLLKQYHNLADPGYALDLQCGGGAEAVFLAERGFIVEALDSLQDNLEKALHLAEKKGVAVDFQNMAASEYKIRKGRYSLITGGAVLRHLPKSEARALAEKMSAGLKPGGVIIGQALTVEDPSCREFRRKKILSVERDCFQMPGGWIYAFYDHREILDIFPALQIIYYSENSIYNPGPGKSGWEGIVEFVFKKTSRGQAGRGREKA